MAERACREADLAEAEAKVAHDDAEAWLEAEIESAELGLKGLLDAELAPHGLMLNWPGLMAECMQPWRGMGS